MEKDIKKKAIIYINAIEDTNCEDVRDSITYQEKVIKAYCEGKGYQIAKVYKEDNYISTYELISGDSALRKLLKDYSDGNIEGVDDTTDNIVITMSLDSFGDEDIVYFAISHLMGYEDSDYIYFETIQDGGLYVDFNFRLNLEKNLKQLF